MNQNMLYRLKRYGTITFLLAILVTLSSCIPQKKIILMQDKDKDGKDVFEALEHITDRYLLQANDYLYVMINSTNSRLKQIFNPNSTNGTNIGADQGRFQYYLIDDEMSVDLPVLGKINLQGCNLKQAKEKITAEVSKYTDDFAVTVRLATNSFTCLGEFSSQGVKTMTRDQITIYEALAMAGGFNSYAKRNEVKLLRQDELGQVHIYYLDLTDDSIINSDFYYIYPNDILYARPSRFKSWGIGENFSLSLLTSITTVISLYLLIVSLF